MCTRMTVLICMCTHICVPICMHVHVQLATLISRAMEWDLRYVLDILLVRLYCCARVDQPSGTKDSRTYWSTDSRYPHLDGTRRDMVEIDLGNNQRGMAQLVSFIAMEQLPDDAPVPCHKAVLIRWLSVSTRSQGRDNYGRPLCGYPLSNNHCLWQWSDAGRVRLCFTRRGFANTIARQRLWDHVPAVNRDREVDKEKRARYDIINYDSIVCHANTTTDPSTGHMLQTIQMI